MNKTLILIRHAHRDTSDGRELDNGLSEKGQKQARRLSDYYRERFNSKKAVIYSSPSLRCLETVEPLADAIGTTIEKSELLTEKWALKKDETDREFLARIQKFIKLWMHSKNEITIACSHGDWIPEILKTLVQVQTEIKKGGWAEIQLKDDLPKLAYLIQKFV